MTRATKFRIGAVVSVIVLVSLIGLSVTAHQAMYERDVARAEVDRVQARVGSLMTERDAVVAAAQAVADRRRAAVDLVHGLRGQVEWDKDHLLDCWTVIVNTVQRSRLLQIFGNLDGLVRAAKEGEPLDHYVRRCAADAVP